jgi:hypothetical protein
MSFNSIRLPFLLCVSLNMIALQTHGDESSITPAQAKAAGAAKEVIGHRGSAADRPENILASFLRPLRRVPTSRKSMSAPQG